MAEETLLDEEIPQAPPAAPEAQPDEGIRSWYKRNTKRSIRALIGASIILIVAAIVLWILAELPFLARMQTFNGALVIPGFGGLWIASFMFIWLIPMREVSFRGQESMERMEAKLQTTMDEKFIPAIEAWRRIGERMEKETIPKFEKFLVRAETALAQVQKSTQNLEEKAEPAIRDLRHLETHVDAYIQAGLLNDIRDAAESLKNFMGVQGAPMDLDRAIENLNQPRNGPAVPGYGRRA